MTDDPRCRFVDPDDVNGLTPDFVALDRFECPDCGSSIGSPDGGPMSPYIFMSFQCFCGVVVNVLSSLRPPPTDEDDS